MRIKSISAAACSLLFAVAVVVVPVSALSMETVRPENIRPVAEAASGTPGWYRETRGLGTAEITTTKPYNALGSLEFNTTTGFDYAEVALYNKLPTYKLSDFGLNELSYMSYQATGDLQAVALQIGVDFDTTDSDTAWQGRMVYEPYMNTALSGSAPVGGEWQAWLTNASDAKWWMTWSAAATTKYGANPCPQSSPCTWTAILSQFPNAGFNAGFGNPLVMKAGSGWNEPRTVFADMPFVKDTMWDFEPTAPQPTTPTNKDQCKNDGWKTFSAGYMNQGQCVSAVVSNRP